MVEVKRWTDRKSPPPRFAIDRQPSGRNGRVDRSLDARASETPVRSEPFGCSAQLKRVGPRFVGAALAVLIVSCGGDRSTEAGAVLVRDSAGMRIVESSAPRWETGYAWTVSTDAIVTLGTVDGGGADSFFSVQDAILLADGRIVVADGGTNELRIFDQAGTHLQSIGGTGDGPGEFRWLLRIWTSADSTVAYDNARSRVSVFGPNGLFARSFVLERTANAGRVSGRSRFADGTLLVLAAPFGQVPRATGILPGAEWVLQRYTVEGSFINAIAGAPESPRWGHEIPGLPPGAPLPFSVGLFPFTVQGNTVLFGTALTHSVSRWTNTGRPELEIRWKAAARRVSSADVDRFRRTMIDQVPPGVDRAGWNEYLRGVPFPEFMPTYSRLLSDARQNVWIEEFRAPWEHEPAWSVFDSAGVWLGTVRTPPGLHVTQVGYDAVLGIHRDLLGVEYVSLFGLQRD
jgi:hypothetical protein